MLYYIIMLYYSYHVIIITLSLGQMFKLVWFLPPFLLIIQSSHLAQALEDLQETQSRESSNVSAKH